MRFNQRGETLSLAESCTGGLLSATIAAQPGVSRFFRGAVVSYHGDVKTNILGVRSTLIKALGEVSTAVAQEMAVGARLKLKSDWALAITGVAGPTGGSPEKPVGFVCFSLVGPGFSEVRTQTFKAKSREFIQAAAVEFALNWLCEI